MVKYKMITWNQWLNWAHLELRQSFSPKKDAEIILKKVVNKSYAQLLAFENTILTSNQIIQLNSLIYRRKKGEPIAYLIGTKEFWSLDFKISAGAFIPRPDTECLIEQVLRLFPIANLQVLDLGTGIGTIALSIASERPSWNIIGIDRQKIALKLAYKNKLLLKIKNVNFFYGNWFKYLKRKKFNLIISNPPYIDKNDKCWLVNDICFEPTNALLSKNYGLEDLITICKNSVNHLYPKGWLFLEHGWNQGKSIRSLFYKFGFHNIQTILDVGKNERVTYGQL